jgi:protein-disulfide isomerase
MIDEKLKIAALGGAAGAALVLAAGLAAGALGLIPVASDARLHGYLMAHPDIIFDMAAKAQDASEHKEQAERQAAIDKLGVKTFFDPAVAYVTGPANAKNTFVEFFDYNCVHCRNTFATVRRFYEAHKNDTRFAFIELPINGPASTYAARAAVAARKQGDKYLQLHFMLMGERQAIDGNLLSADLAKAGIDAKKLAADMTAPDSEKPLLMGRGLAEEIKVSGTPAFIVNGKFHDGEISDADLKAITK